MAGPFSFPKGVSGNHGGRPPAALHVQEMARQKTPQALAALIAALDSPRERVPAAIALLDRGWGRPLQMIAADPERPIAVEFQWADATPATNTDARSVGQQIEAAIIDAVAEDSDR